MLEIHEKTEFEKEVLQSKQPVLVCFSADWCGPCKALYGRLENVLLMKPEIEKNLKICKFNAGHNPALAFEYGVGTVPTLAIFENGKQIDFRNDAPNSQTLSKWLAKYE